MVFYDCIPWPESTNLTQKRRQSARLELELIGLLQQNEESMRNRIVGQRLRFS